MDQLCADTMREYQRLFGLVQETSLQNHGIIDVGYSRVFELFLPAWWSNTDFFGVFGDLPKPQHSYIGLIAMAIQSSPEQRMVLAEVYEWIMTHYPYFRQRGTGWRNSIRHNLSLNDCFVKAGRAANGKGHYWAVHPACAKDFERGDFRRRRAQRKVRRHMGLSVGPAESSDESRPASPSLPISFSIFPQKKPSDFSIRSLLGDVIIT